MTLLDIPADVRPDFRRDRWGRPLVVPVDGGKAKPYTRASSAAKAIEDTFGLEKWGRRNVAFGMASDSSLVARIVALGGSPHTWSSDDKKAADAIVEDAQRVAQAHKAADIGTALHRIVERHLLGEDVDAGPFAAQLAAFVEAFTTAGWSIVNDHVECRMVCDELEMAGTTDMIVRRPDDTYAIADLKTGSSVSYGGLGYAAQLAAYANGALYAPDDDTRPDMPTLDTEVGHIVHLPANGDECTIYDIDLVEGFRAATLANEVRAIRKASKKWMTATAQIATPETPTSVESPPAADNPRTASAAGNTFYRLDPGPHTWQICETCNVGGHVCHFCGDELSHAIANAPRGSSNRHPCYDEVSDDDGNTEPSAADLNARFRTDPDEGGDADLSTVEQRYRALTDEQRTWIGSIAKEAIQAGVSFHAKEAHTVRRHEILRGLVTLAPTLDDTTDEALRLVVSTVLDTDAAQFPTVARGRAVGSMSADEAARFAQLCVDLLDARLSVETNDDGTTRLVQCAAYTPTQEKEEQP